MNRIIVKFWLTSLFVLCHLMSAHAALDDGSALIVIDVQKAFSEPDGFSPVCREQADNMLPVINRLIDQFAKASSQIIYIKQEYVRDTEFDSRLKIIGDLHFTKKQPSAFSNKEFENYLKSKNITKLYVVGLAAEYCLSATVSEALKKGLEVTVIGDGVAAKMCSSLQDEIESYKDKGAQVVLSKDIR
ncbi:cysteine hydrolase family protein [Desulforhopalus sp. 52FAK]